MTDLSGLHFRTQMDRPLTYLEADENFEILRDGVSEALNRPAVVPVSFTFGDGGMTITLSDGSTLGPFESPVGISEAPLEGRFVRSGKSWQPSRELPQELPASDGVVYGFKNGQLFAIESGGGSDPGDGSGSIPDLPDDAFLYGIQNKVWTRIPTYGGGAAGPVGRIRVHAYRDTTTAGGVEFFRYPVPDGYVVPGLFAGTRLSFSDQSGRGGAYGNIVYVFVNPRGFGAVDTENDPFVGRFLINKDGTYTMERQSPGEGETSVDPFPLPSGGVLTLVLDGGITAPEWISVDIALDPV